MAVNAGHAVPFSHPRASSENFRFRGTGAGGSGPPPRQSSVRPHHTIIRTTITVVTFMIPSASSLDSWMPCVLRHQKYTVTSTATNAAVPPTGSEFVDPKRCSRSFSRPTMYWPAETPLIGPVRT